MPTLRVKADRVVRMQWVEAEQKHPMEVMAAHRGLLIMSWKAIARQCDAYREHGSGAE